MTTKTADRTKIYRACVLTVTATMIDEQKSRISGHVNGVPIFEWAQEIHPDDTLDDWADKALGVLGSHITAI